MPAAMGTGRRCGTYNGYRDHQRLNEEVCQACRDAANAACRASRAARQGRTTAATTAASGWLGEVLLLAAEPAPSRRFGVEIEFRRCNGGRPALVRAMQRRGLAVRIEDYNHHISDVWKIVTDGSCGYELVSPPLEGAAGIVQVQAACDALRDVNAQQGAACGVHVHVETRDLTVAAGRRLLESYRHAQPVLNTLLTASRQHNHFCQPISSERDVESLTGATTLEQLARHNRYRVVNFNSFLRYGTIEFRQHHATRRGQRVTDWVRLVVSLTDLAITGGVLPDGVSAPAMLAMAQDRGLGAPVAARLAALAAGAAS